MKCQVILILVLGICGFAFGEPLRDPAMRPLPLGSVKAEGWLKNQLRIQADGLSGHLDEFWPDIKESRWFGGDKDGWERAPYWLDGVIPLAYTLDDPALKKKVGTYVETILERQHEDGWLGPKDDNLSKFDLWSHFLALKMLGQYYEATGDERVSRAMIRGLKRIQERINDTPIRKWGKFRWFEALIAINQLYEKQQEAWLLDLARQLRNQGFDWIGFFEEMPVTEPTPKGKWNLMGHVVNNAMALKTGALCWRQTGDERDRMAVYDMLNKLDKYHGMAAGMFTGDECLAGKNPTQGTELCAVVECMFSLEILLSILGDAAFGDRLEKITFNALPATFSPDMWSHQYDQQINQVECSIKERNWTTNGKESNIFGLQPNYGCCTSNLSQGWPKFAAHLWMKTKDGGLAAVAFAPSHAVTSIDGTKVEAMLRTDYPFRDKLYFTVTAEEPVRFPLYLRIPAWAGDAFLVVGREKLSPEPGKFFKIERRWNGKTELLLTLPMKPSATRRYNNAIAIERGPLVFALKIAEQWKAVNEGKKYREPPHGDWEVYPRSDWNYALDVAPDSIVEDVVFIEKTVGPMPFSPKGAPVEAHVRGVKVPAWKMVMASCGETPTSPVNIEGPLEKLTLIPYGCTNLRITEFPTLK
ncbi:MAG: beta-L-arabinofuranosidase domain-containing protein [Planctomycetota bacterium]